MFTILVGGIFEWQKLTNFVNNDISLFKRKFVIGPLFVWSSDILLANEEPRCTLPP